MFVLDPRLARDCFDLGRLALSRLLLMDNAALPWLILVPEANAPELCDLPPSEQVQLLKEINEVSRLVRGFEGVTRLNIAAIGNIVSQLHVHVVGRHPGDYCWPGVVWGSAAPGRYQTPDVERIRARAAGVLGQGFTPTAGPG